MILRKLLVVVLVLALGGGITAGSAALWLSNYLKTPLPVTEAVEVELSSGTPLGHFARDLEGRGLLLHARWFSLYVRYRGWAGAIKAGEYRLAPGITPAALIVMLREGRVIDRQVTLVEGKTLREWLQVLKGTPQLAQVASGLSAEELLNQLGVGESHLEGLLYPDTYHFRRGDSDLDILRRAYQQMQKILAEEWAGRAEGLPLSTPYEALILASIVEKETGVAHERAEIAGVFVRRLQKKMRLQTDPTVIYGLGDAFKGNLTRRDLRRRTAYNTYRISGLPPTPIAMPGRAAIHAALHPAPGNSLYFVARGDGSHHFSSTLEEHSRAVQKYQVRQRRSDYRSQPPTSASEQQ